MPAPLKLLDLFPSLADRWLYDQVPADERDAVSWFASLNEAVTLLAPRIVTSTEGVAIECEFTVQTTLNSGGPGSVIPRDGYIAFQIRPIRGVEFRLLNTHNKRGRLFISLRDAGAEILIEQLPVEIVLPPDLVTQYYTAGRANQPGTGLSEPVDPDLLDALQTFKNKEDDQVVVLKDIATEGGTTSIFTHLRLHVTPELDFVLSTPAPISFGKCTFMGFPCLTVHDFQLIPAPRLAHDRERHLIDSARWIRHGITGQFPGGAFGVRTIELDFNSDFFRNLWPRYRWHSVKADWVFQDLVMTLDAAAGRSPFPVPLQATIGVRRNIDNISDASGIFSFDQAPIDFFAFNNKLHVRAYELFFRSQEDGLEAFVQLGFAFGDDSLEPENNQDWEIRFESAEDLTFRLGAVWLPDDNFPLRLQISDDLIVDPFGLMLSYSIGKAIQGRDFGDCFEATGSIWLHAKNARLDRAGGSSTSSSETGTDTGSGTGAGSANSSAPIRVETVNGSPFSVVITNVGWRQGKIVFETFSLPDGSSAWLGPIAIDLYEMGVINEDQADYFSISGGLRIKEAEKFEGRVGFERMRFRIAGNESAPFFKLDGFSGLLKVPNLAELEFGGYYREETTIERWQREFGFSGSLKLKLGEGNEWKFALDLIGGRMREFSSGEEFGYFMLQLLISGRVTIGAIDLRSIRFLLSINMKPKLSAENAREGEFRYYRWQKSTDPIKVPGDRRLRAWEAQNDAVAFGIGFGLSFAGLGDVVKLVAFFMYVNAPEDSEEGFLIAIEMFLGTADNPLAWAILEYDMQREKFSVLIGVDVNISQFINNAPEFLDNLFKIKGTIFIGNRPGTFALGRLDDQTSWMLLLLDFNLFGVFRSYMMFALCIEIVEGGPEGVGILFRVEGGIDCGFWSLSYYAGLIFLYRTFRTGSADFVVLAAVELGASITLLRFLRFGLGLRGEIRHVGNEPTYTTFMLRIHIETPWWLPDVSWTFEHVEGSILPATRSVVAPLSSSCSALQAATGYAAPVYLERIHADLFSLEDLAAYSSDEADRLANFARAQAESEDVEPLPLLPTDVVIVVQFAQPVEQSLGIGPINPMWGTQLTGDDQNYLKQRHRLTAITVRRRPRFGAFRPWSTLEEHREIRLVPDGRGGVVASGEFAPTALSYLWDADVQVAGENAPVRLLINGTTPFSFATQNVENDDNLLRHNPQYPCCQPSRPRWHRYAFRDESEGMLNRSRQRRFSDSNALLLMTANGIIRPDPMLESPPYRVAACPIIQTRQTVLWAVFDEDAVLATLRVLVLGRTGNLLLQAQNAAGKVVSEQKLEANQKDGWQILLLSGEPFRSIRLVAMRQQAPWSVCVDACQWLTWHDYESDWSSQQACAATHPSRRLDYSGNGSVFFLPNYEYEIALHGEISVRHNSTEWETQSSTDYLYFATKGLPGLNFVERTGAELTPYVQSFYPNRRGIVYGIEPVTLVLNEKLKTALPIDLRRPGATPEHTQLQQLRLAVQGISGNLPLQPVGLPSVTDWLTARRTSSLVLTPWLSLQRPITARSTDKQLNRLEALLQASTGAECGNREVTLTHQSLLVASPFGVERNGTICWAPGAGYFATVGLDNTVFIHRLRFESADLTALTQIGSTAAWTIANGTLSFTSSSAAIARFGESDWNHFLLETELSELVGTAGLAIGINATGTNGLYALVCRLGESVVLKITRSIASDAPSLAERTLPLSPSFLLQVTAFDDTLLVKLNGEAIVAPRHEIREGYCGLCGQGAAIFHKLRAEPLPMFGFAFRASRFPDFEAHVRDFGTQVHVLPQMGNSDFALVRSAHQATIAHAMNATASDAERESAMVRFAAAAGLMLTQNAETSRCSAILTADGHLRAVLFESPEPLDVAAGEVTIAAQWFETQIKRISLRNLRGLEPLLQAVNLSGGLHGLLPGVLHNLLSSGPDPWAEFRSLPNLPGTAPARTWTYTPLLETVAVKKVLPDGNLELLVEFDTLIDAPIEVFRDEALLYVVYQARENVASVYEIDIGREHWSAKLIRKLPVQRSLDRNDLSYRFVLMSRRRRVVFGEAISERREWQNFDLRILQNGDATKILVFPEALEGTFASGLWQFNFKIHRSRFASEVPDPVAFYDAGAILEIKL